MQQTFSTIDDAGLSTRVRNALVGLQVTDIKQLATLTEHDLLRSPNIGRKSLDEICDLLGRHGLVLGMVFPPAPEPDAETPRPPRAPFDLRACLARRLAQLEQWAAEGCPSAANVVGACSLGAHGNTTEPGKARRFLVQAARGGSGLGAYNLGLLHLDGIGVPASRRVAERWFRRARRLGCGVAAGALASLSPAGNAGSHHQLDKRGQQQ